MSRGFLFNINPTTQRLIRTSGTVADGSPLIVVCPPVDPTKFRFIAGISAIAKTAAGGVPTPNPCYGPANGIFLIDASDSQAETLATAGTGGSLSFQLRATPLDTRTQAFIQPDTTAFVSLVYRGGPFVLQPNYLIVAVLCPNPQTASPGPGAGSIMNLSVLCSDEDQATC